MEAGTATEIIMVLLGKGFTRAGCEFGKRRRGEQLLVRRSDAKSVQPSLQSLCLPSGRALSVAVDARRGSGSDTGGGLSLLDRRRTARRRHARRRHAQHARPAAHLQRCCRSRRGLSLLAELPTWHLRSRFSALSPRLHHARGRHRYALLANGGRNCTTVYRWLEPPVRGVRQVRPVTP